MKVTVKLLKPFSDIAGKDEINLDFEGEFVSQALENLCQLHPKLKNELYDAKGEISYTVRFSKSQNLKPEPIIPHFALS
jgi:molybdopterin converting factor small subunit